MSRSLIILIFISVSILLNAQSKRPSELVISARENRISISKNPNSSLADAKKIQKKAFIESDHTAELIAISTQCIYYEKNSNFKDLISVSQLLSTKAISYDLPIYNAVAKDYLFRAYILSGLKEKGFQNIKEGLAITENIEDKNDSLYVDTKSNLFTSFSNYYSSEKKPRERLKYIRLAVKEHQKFKNLNYRKKLRFLDYSNLAVAYNDLNVDSAVYYAKLSMKTEHNYNLNNAAFTNFLIIGTAYFDKGYYEDALVYLRQAERIKDSNNHFNVELLYEILAKTYNKLDDISTSQKYRIKLDSVKLTIAEKQNQSLHKIITDKTAEPEKSLNKIYVYLLPGLALIFVSVFLFLKRKKVLSNNFDNPPENILNDRRIEYSELMEMFKKNDIAFMAYFNECFPNFSQKLTEINPKIIQSEIEFCALLKLNISTKDIGKYKNLAYRTVQNKKYLIRKKLEIPVNVDIYQWFINI